MGDANSIRTLGDHFKPSHEGYRNTIELPEGNNVNNPIVPEEGNLDYGNPDIKHLLGVMEYKGDMLMKDALSLIGGSESIFRMTTNETYRLPPESSRQEEFEHIMTNFILDQEESLET
ncbi:hypothetical protein Tco_0045510 [Tanacetum coccineum]